MSTSNLPFCPTLKLNPTWQQLLLNIASSKAENDSFSLKTSEAC